MWAGSPLATAVAELLTVPWPGSALSAQDCSTCLESDHTGDAFPPECGKKSWAPRSSVRGSVINRPVHRAQASCLCHWGLTGICDLTADRSGAAGSRTQEARPGPRVWVCVWAHTPLRGKPGMQGDSSSADDGAPQQEGETKPERLHGKPDMSGEQGLAESMSLRTHCALPRL